MPARRLDISDPSLALPDLLGLDASIVLAINIPSGVRPSPHLAAVQAFWRRVASGAHGGRLIPVLPQLAFEECCFKLCQYHLEQLANFSSPGVRWHEYYKQHPYVLRSFHSTLDTLYHALLAIPVLITEPEDLAVSASASISKLTESALAFIRDFALLPKDATLLSEFERLGIDTVATLDADWQRADGFTVITPF